MDVGLVGVWLSGSLFTTSREVTISLVEEQRTSSLSAILVMAFTTIQARTWESIELLASEARQTGLMISVRLIVTGT